MNKTFETILQLIERGDVRISDHGYNELRADNISARDVFSSVVEGIVIEDYPDNRKGPCVLVLQKDRLGQAIHTVWGIPKGFSFPAVLITAYKPDPIRWEADFLRRKK
ncbi:MAG: DUF4258 domain-containing protein [Candidatus Omnitrophota bacterium]